MQQIVQQLAVEHAREAALLWSLHDEEPDDDLRERIRRQVAGMRACVRRGADPLAGLERPLAGADLLPAACLGPVEAEDETGQRAIAAARDYA